jgi:acetyl esterase/lipase
MAATMATQFDAGKPDATDPIDRASSRPDFAALLYPVITFTDEQHMHKGSRDALLGTRTELYEKMSAEKQVKKDTPPIFIAQSSMDRTVPVENSILFYMACRANQVPAEMHIFEIGGHGFGLAPTDPALHVWPELLMNWMVKNKWIKATAIAAPAK